MSARKVMSARKIIPTAKKNYLFRKTARMMIRTALSNLSWWAWDRCFNEVFIV